MLGRLRDTGGLIISQNAWGFPMFSPYTHSWPMTHQPLYPHSKPLLHYLNREASCRKVGGRIVGFSWFIYPLTSYKWRMHDLHLASLVKYCTCYAFFQRDLWKEADHFHLYLADCGVGQVLSMTEHRHIQRLTSVHRGTEWNGFSNRPGMYSAKYIVVFLINIEIFNPNRTQKNKQWTQSLPVSIYMSLCVC